jgi:archaeosine-15-forming tRNA-guanine transglycosylase
MSEKKMPRRRLVVSDEAIPFVARGGRIFDGQVIDADLDIVDGEEVLVVNKENRIITTARAVL